MQNTKLFRRGIVLPDNPEAEECLRFNDVTESTSVQFLEIPDQAFFEALWELQLFQEINSRIGSLIDDYEEEFIDPESIDGVFDAIKTIRSKQGAQSLAIQTFLNDLMKLASDAKKQQRVLLFVL